MNVENLVEKVENYVKCSFLHRVKVENGVDNLEKLANTKNALWKSFPQ